MRSILFPALAITTLGLAACSGQSDTSTSAESGQSTAPATAADSKPDASGAVLDPNTASAEQLAGVAGFTPELAAAVVAGRPYASASAFNTKLLETLSPEQADAVRASVFVPIDLNSASEADIELIPGMSDKMVHEFLEYRPYENMAEFDREIGKYVDEAEVARLRRYVTL